MVYLTLPEGHGEPEDYTAHLVGDPHAETMLSHHEGHEEAKVVPMCMTTPYTSGSIRMPVWRLCKARGYATDANMEWWGQAEHVDRLADLLTRLTVDGLMCQECVEEYRDRVDGLKGLGRRYYPDEYGVDRGEPGRRV